MTEFLSITFDKGCRKRSKIQVLTGTLLRIPKIIQINFSLLFIIKKHLNNRIYKAIQLGRYIFIL